MSVMSAINAMSVMSAINAMSAIGAMNASAFTAVSASAAASVFYHGMNRVRQ